MFVKIVHTITKLEFGGAQLGTLYTLDNIDANCIGFLISSKGGMLDERAIKSKFINRFCPFLKREINPFYDFLAFLWFFFYFKEIKPDILHSHSSKAGIIARLAAKLVGVPIIIHTFHGFGFTPLQRPIVRNFFIIIEKWTAKWTTKLIAVSYANVEKGLKYGIGNKEKYIVIRSGIDFEKFEIKKNNGIKKKIGLKNTDKLIGNISCFKPQKGLKDYIAACTLLSKKGDYYFLLAGDGVQRKELEKYIRQSGLKERFFMLGWQKHTEDIIPYLDVMLHTSYFEGLPRVFLEAMASSIAIVATDVDGARDVIKDGVNGYLVKCGDVKGLAESAYKILEDDNLRKKMAVSSKNLLVSEFSIEEMSKRLNKLYSTIS